MLPTRRDAVAAALDQPPTLAGTILVRFRVQHPKVVLPDVMRDLQEEGLLNLRYSNRYRLPIELLDDGIHATLSHGGQNHRTFVPWGAILLIVEESTGTHVVWPLSETEPEPEPEPKPKQHLKLV